MGAYSYKPVADDNTTIDGVAAQGGSDPKLLDNINRYQAAALANFVRDLGGANTVGGVADAISVTLADLTAPTAYFDGMVVVFRAAYNNATSTPTVNVNGLGTKTIKKASNGAEAALAPGDITAASVPMLMYRASWASGAGAFQLFNPAIGGSAPVGSIMDYCGTTAPTGWLLCYGQAISRTTYASLFAALGTTYGAGDGSTTFNLPDLRGRVTAGQDDMGGTSANRLTGVSGGVDGDTLGGTGGAETHTLTTAQLAAHNHGINISDPGHSHLTAGHSSTPIWGSAGGHGYGFVVDTSGGGGSYYYTSASGTGISASSNNNGSGSAHNNVQPTIILNKIIYAGV
jgi:microcystin-dependent protein